VEWLEKKSRKGDKAYVSYKEPNKLGSFLSLKIEDENESYGDFDMPFTKSKRVKISTFKVSDIGKRIGESFLKIIFQYTKEHKIDEIYVTIFDKQIELIDLFSQYGFTFFCYKNTKNAEGTIVKEGVYLKKISDHNYPHLKYTNQNIFVIPILPKFHLKLFKESEAVYQISIEDVDGISTYSNSIKKAYLSNSNIKKLKKGDILFFYASKTKQAITTIGVVDAVFTDFSSIEEIYNLANKITVYTREEIEKIFSKESKVIMFKYYSSLNPTIPLSRLINDDIVKAAPQTITEISQSNISRLLDIVKESTQVIK
ncbi:MAG: EVE domain-containing protein, partial [Bacilli bacterium]|nr:EVE domain-containing protein [Bacilli bacterium]